MTKTEEKTTSKPAKDLRLKKTFKLRRKLIDENGDKLSELEVTEPRLGDVIRAEKTYPKSDTRQLVLLLSLLTGHPETTFNRLVPADLNEIRGWMDEIGTVAAVKDEEARDEADDSFTLSLCVPLGAGDDAITEITVVAPDVGAQIAAEDVKDPIMQTATVIAHATGLNLAETHKLARRDIARIEAFMAPFVGDTDSRTGGAGV